MHSQSDNLTELLSQVLTNNICPSSRQRNSATSSIQSAFLLHTCYETPRAICFLMYVWFVRVEPVQNDYEQWFFAAASVASVCISLGMSVCIWLLCVCLCFVYVFLFVSVCMRSNNDDGAHILNILFFPILAIGIFVIIAGLWLGALRPKLS